MSSIMVRHFRRYTKQVGSDGQGGHKVVDVPKPGGLTLATVRDGDAIRFGVARCMKQDTFDKEEGRKQAVERLAAATEECDVRGLDKVLANSDRMNGIVEFKDVKRLLSAVRRRT